MQNLEKGKQQPSVVFGRMQFRNWLFFLFRKTWEKFQALFGTSVHTSSAEDAAKSFKLPLFGVAADLNSVGRTLFGTKTAKDALIFFDDQLSPFTGERLTLLKRVVPGGGTFDQIAENIFEN